MRTIFKNFFTHIAVITKNLIQVFSDRLFRQSVIKILATKFTRIISSSFNMVYGKKFILAFTAAFTFGVISAIHFKNFNFTSVISSGTDLVGLLVLVALMTFAVFNFFKMGIVIFSTSKPNFFSVKKYPFTRVVFMVFFFFQGVFIRHNNIVFQ